MQSSSLHETECGTVGDMMGQDVAIEQTPSRCCAVPTGDDMPEVWTLIHGYDGRRGRALEQSGDGEQIASPP